jgi:external thioesterase TEII
MKTLFFPFAGGSRYSFPHLRGLSGDFVFFDYPGRGQRMGESLVSNIDQLVESMLDDVRREIEAGGDYAVYGHSMGALVGYLICHKLFALDLRMPTRLIVSGKKAPSVKHGSGISHLKDDLFWQEVTKMGGIPDGLLCHSELTTFFCPILKADFEAIESYEHRPASSLGIPIDVFYGTADANKDDMTGWVTESESQVTINEMSGGHFFIFDHIEFFQNYFTNIT